MFARSSASLPIVRHGLQEDCKDKNEEDLVHGALGDMLRLSADDNWDRKPYARSHSNRDDVRLRGDLARRSITEAGTS